MRISDWSSDVCSSVLIVGCALDDTVTLWNKGAARLLGRTADEVVGACRLAEVLPDDATAAVERAVEAVVGGDRAQHVTTIQIEQDGRRRHLAVTIAPVHDATDAVVALSVVVRDITTLLTAEIGRAECRERGCRYV